MELTNAFKVGVAVADAWDVLTDVERIAPCLPGAQLQEVAGDSYRGIVKVKVGPITAQYKGEATFIEQDKDAGRAVLKAEGRDVRGQGNASALITATLTADGDGTEVKVVTDLTITGRVAQFGRGVLADVSSKLLGQFVDCLENDLLAGMGASSAAVGQAEGATNGASKSDGGAERSNPSPNGPTGSAPTTTTPPTATATPPTATATPPTATATPPTESGERPETATRRIESREPEAVDLLDAAGVPVAKRAIPLVAAALVLVLLLRRWRKRRR